MLTGYGFRHYRGFASADIDIRPITVLLGANGVGKTSIMQVPLIMEQTAAPASGRYESALRHNGRRAHFGDVENLFHCHDTKRPVEFSFRIVPDRALSLLKGRLLSEFDMSIVRLGQHVASASPDIVSSPEGERLLSLVGSDASRRTWSRHVPQILDSLDALLPMTMAVQGSAGALRLIVPYLMSTVLQVADATFDVGELRRARSFLANIRNAVSDVLEVTLRLRATGGKKAERKLVCDCVTIKSANVTLLSVQMPSSRRSAKVTSEVFPDSELENCGRYLSPLLEYKGPVFGVFGGRKNTGNGSVLGEFVRTIGRYVLDDLADEFAQSNINHVAPLRAYPKRYYFLDYATTGSTQGDNLVESLRENASLLKEVNQWLARFNIVVDVQQFKEIIHQLTIRRGDNAFDLDITDVGFGLSQVLPVIVQSYLAAPGSLTVIEQPEIHLHPKMQADLADLFVAVTRPTASSPTGSPRRLLIETHSEYLLNRLRRRIAEGAISRDDVAIYFVHDSKGSEGQSIVRNIEIGHAGAFEWPEEFFEDSLEDTIAFLERQEGA